MRTSRHFALLLIMIGALGSTSPSTPAAHPTLADHQPWEKLPGEFLGFLEGRLGNNQRIQEFIQLTSDESLDIGDLGLVAAIAATDRHYAAGLIAASLTSVANQLGEDGEFRLARRFLLLAIDICPKHQPAWGSMALTEALLGNCREATRWAKNYVSYTPDPESQDSWERAQAGQMSNELRQEVQSNLGADPAEVSAVMASAMKQIIAMCE